MNQQRWTIYGFVIAVLALFAIIGVVGMQITFSAADDARVAARAAVATAARIRSDEQQRRCEHQVLADATHVFHLSVAAIEAAEANDDAAAILRIARRAQHEPDIEATMESRCG